MKLHIGIIGAGIMAGLLAYQPVFASEKIEVSGHCKMENREAGVELYNGNCTIKEEVKHNGNYILWDIRMGAAESFLFACHPDGNCMHGPDEVKYKDHGDSATFGWGNFRLDVAAKAGNQSSHQSHGNSSRSASSGAESACMSAVNGNYGGNVENLDVVSSEFSQANSVVNLNADGTRWRCLVSSDNEVQELTVQE